MLISEIAKTLEWNNNRQIGKILGERTRLKETPGQILDYPGAAGKFDAQIVSRAVRGSKNHRNGLMLCDIAYLHGGNGVVELGTNLGISSAYLAVGARVANPEAQIATGDCSGKRLNIARSVHLACELDNIEYIEGLFEDTAETIFTCVPGWTVAFIDGDHTYEGTLRYHTLAQETGASGNVVIFDDVDWSEGMKAAWSEIAAKHRSASQRLGDMGLVRL